MSMHIRYCAAEKLAGLEERPDLLAVICYGATPKWEGRCPCVSLPMATTSIDRCEVLSAGIATYGQFGDVRYAHDGEWLFAAVTVPEHQGLSDTVVGVYGQILQTLDRLGYPCLVRAWQHFPDIHEPEQGLERYRQFNQGRHRALAPYLVRGGIRPAATCVGSAGPGLVVYVLARATSGIAIENPRQIAAYHYPTLYGPRSPDFVRAMKVHSDGEWYLWISGTAAIVGHESRGTGDLDAQVSETFANLDAVVAQADLAPDAAVLATKVYLRTPGVLSSLPKFWRDSPIIYITGDICRQELAVEIEAVLHSSRSSPSRDGSASGVG
ncbi:MAG: chorismate transformation enzyme, FkbO/Hyg5 family [Acidiferrobacter sp.]